MAKVAQFFGALVIGGLAGLAVGMLTAPKAGRESRKKIAQTADNLYRKAAYELEELAEHVEDLRIKIDEMDMPQPARRALATIGGAVQDFTPNVQEKIDLIQTKIGETRQAFQDRLTPATETLSEKLHLAKDVVSNVSEKVSQLSGQLTIDKAQNALAQHDETIAHSQEVLQQTSSPAIEKNDGNQLNALAAEQLNELAAEQLASKLGAKVNTDTDIQQSA